MAGEACSVADCERSVLARGWCNKHYTRWRTYGDPLACQFDRDPAVRFFSQVEKTGGCWLWIGAVNRYGYGKFHLRRDIAAHRFAYEMLVGPIPNGLHLDHLCRVRQCVNPAHLEPVTVAENNRRSDIATGARSAAERCPSGHIYDADNTRSYRGKRHCRACDRARPRRPAKASS